MAEYANFRQRLDAVLRTLDVKQVSDFLISEGQWSEGVPADPTFAMWMMVAGSPTLHDLHPQAREWLVNHGHEEEARMVLSKSSVRTGGSGKSVHRPKSGTQLPPFKGKKKSIKKKSHRDE